MNTQKLISEAQTNYDRAYSSDVTGGYAQLNALCSIAASLIVIAEALAKLAAIEEEKVGYGEH